MAAINFTGGVVPETYQDDYRVVFENPHVMKHIPTVLFAFLYALLFTVARFVLDRVLFYPLADLLLGTSASAESKHVESGHAEWRRLLTQGSRPTQQQIADAAAQSSSDPVRVAEWLKKASAFKKAPKMRVKFADSAWRFCCYSFSSAFAIVVLFPKAWFWDTSSYWSTVPNPIDPEVHFYYMYGIGFYSHLIIAQFYEERKKDFWQMFFHHLVTICLFVFSYLLGFTRVGVAILFLHDLSDPFLEFAKIWNYCKLKSISEVFFALFALVFAVSRLYYFPRYIIYSTWHETALMAGPFHGAYRFWRMFNLLLFALLALHIFWFSIILKMAIKLLFFNEFKGDARSDLESEDEAAGKKRK